MTFPDSKFVDAGSYANAYFTKFKDAAATVDRERLVQAAGILTRVYSEVGSHRQSPGM